MNAARSPRFHACALAAICAVTSDSGLPLAAGAAQAARSPRYHQAPRTRRLTAARLTPGGLTASLALRLLLGAGAGRLLLGLLLRLLLRLAGRRLARRRFHVRWRRVRRGRWRWRRRRRHHRIHHAGTAPAALREILLFEHVHSSFCW